MDQISDRVKNELVFMNLIESLQRLWKLLSSEDLFNIDEFENASHDKLSLLYKRSLELFAAEEKKQVFYEQDLLSLKKELYAYLKKLEEEVKVRKEAVLNDAKNIQNLENRPINEDELFKIEEKLTNIKTEIDSLIRSKNDVFAKKLALEKENATYEEKMNEGKEYLEKLRGSYGNLKNKKNLLESDVKKKIIENNELILTMKNLDTKLEKINNDKPGLDDLGEKLIKEYDQMISDSNLITNKMEELSLLKIKLEEELKVKEAQFQELNKRKNKLEVLYAREGTLQQQLKLENEINTTLILENEVLMKQHEFMSDKSTSNSLIFLMNESLVNKMSIHQNEIELPIDMMENKEKKNSDNADLRKVMISEFDKDIKEKKTLVEALKAQINNSNGMNGKNKMNQDIVLRISEIEELLTISEDELNACKI